MPGVPKDMNGYRDFEVGHLRTSSYANGYDPQRPDYRDAGYGRSGRHNGIDPEFEQNSFDGGMRDGTERSFEVDHLATYTSKSGTTHPEDGLMKLKQMESSTGIWTMRCLLMVEPRHIIVIDKGNGDELERFPLSQVHEPTAVLKNDRRETYNNLILFTVIDDPRRKNSPSDMHIFQSVNAPAHDIVDEVLAAKGEGAGRKGPYDRSIPPPPSGPAPEPPYGKSSNYRETDKLAESHRYLGELDLGESRRNERAFGESRKDREEPKLGDSRLSNWGPPRLDDAQLGSSRLGDTGYRETGYRETRLGESRQDESRFGDFRLRESGADDSRLRDTRAGDSQRDEMFLRESRLKESRRDDMPLNGSHQAETRRDDDWMSKSLRYKNTRVGEPRIGASDRFQDGLYSMLVTH